MVSRSHGKLTEVDGRSLTHKESLRKFTEGLLVSRLHGMWTEGLASAQTVDGRTRKCTEIDENLWKVPLTHGKLIEVDGKCRLCTKVTEVDGRSGRCIENFR